MQSVKTFDVYMALAIAAAVALSGQAYAEANVMTDSAGMTVYTFDKDSPGKSVCYGDCAAAWPPVAATSMPAGADFSVVARDDGTKQMAYKGKPLYLFAGDKKPGDVSGDNVQNVWHVLSTGGKPVASSTPKSEYPSGSSYGY